MVAHGRGARAAPGGGLGPGALRALGSAAWLDGWNALSEGERHACVRAGVRGAFAGEPEPGEARALAQPLRPLFDASAGEGGRLLLAPRLAADDRAAEGGAAAYCDSLGCPNVGLRVPAARPALAAALLARGVPVALDGAWSPGRWRAAAEAILSGLEARRARGEDLRGRGGFILFEPARLDAAVDAIVSARIRTAPTASIRSAYELLLGRVGTALAKTGAAELATILNGKRWMDLETAGSTRIRAIFLLAGLSPGESLRYAEHLLGAESALGLTPPQLAALEREGRPAEPLSEGLREARHKLDKLANYQIDLDGLAAELDAQGEPCPSA